MDDHWQPRVRTVPPVVMPVAVDPDGMTGPTKGRARGPAWRRVAVNAYVPACVDDSVVEQRVVEAAARITGTGAITGWAALRLHRAAFFDGLARDGTTRLPVPIATGDDRIRGGGGVALRRDGLATDEVLTRCGVRCTTVHRALLDEIRRSGDLREAVVAIDMAMAAELTSIRRFRSYLDARSRRTRGLALASEALDLACEEARSPQEVRLRLIWVLDAGWDPPLVNRPIYDPVGAFVAVPDLFDPEHGVSAEFDGGDHRTRARHRRDVAREGGLRGVGIETTAFVGADLFDTPLVVARLHSARERAGRLPRRWRMEPTHRPDAEPGAGPDHLTLDERLDLRDWQQEQADPTS